MGFDLCLQKPLGFNMLLSLDVQGGQSVLVLLGDVGQAYDGLL